jgi:hypothetical protein
MRNADLQTRSLAVTLDDKSGELTLWDRKRKTRLLIVPGSALFQPVLNGAKAALALARIERSPGELTLCFASPALGASDVTLKAVADGIEVFSRFTAPADCELNRLDMFPAGTALNFHDVVNFRHRSFSSRMSKKS